MPSTEEILLTFLGQDQVTPVVNSIQGNIQASTNSMSDGYDSTFSRMVSSANSTFDSISRGASNVNQAMMRLQSSSNQILGALGSTKSASELVFGTTSRADTNKVLINHMVDTEEHAQSLYDTVDKITDSSLTSMQDLIPAMNAFKSATQATYDQLNDDVAGSMANFGAFVLAQTGSTELSLTAMMDLSKGIKGQFNALDQYGISSASLEATGLWKQDTSGNGKKWKGDEKDIHGYLEAVNEVIGDTTDLMDTNEGLNAQIGKMWSRAGKRIGNEYLPQIKDLKSAFIELDNETGGQLSTNLLLVSTAIEEISGASYKLDMLLKAFTNVRDLVMALASRWGMLGGAMAENTAQTEGNANATMMNTEQLMANTDARYANADATYAQAQAMSEANMMMGDESMMPSYQSSGGEMTSVSRENVIADTAIYAGGDVASGLINSSSDNTIIDDLIARNKDDVTKAKNGMGDVVARRMELTNDVRRGLIQSEEELARVSADISANIPKVKITNNQEYGAVWDAILDMNVDDDEINLASDLLNDNVESMYTYLGMQSNHNDAIEKLQDQFNSVVDSKGFEGARESEIGQELMQKIQDHKMEKDKLTRVLDGAEGSDEVYNRIGRMFGTDMRDKIDFNALKQEQIGKMTLTDAIKNKFSFLSKGEDVTGVIFDDLEKLDEAEKAPNILSRKFQSLKNSFTNFGKTAEEIEAGTSKGILQRLDYALYNPFREMPQPPLDEIAKGATDMGLTATGVGAMSGEMAVINGTTATLATTSGVASGQLAIINGELFVLDEEMGAVAVSSGALATESEVAGTEMAVAEGGVTFMGLAEMGLAGAFTTLIVPTLAIAGVIAVLIPVMAGLAIEALFFIKLIGQVMDAMNFESINVDGVADKLGELATALGYMALALGALTLVNMVGAIAGATTWLSSAFGGIEGLVELLTEVSSSISALSNMPTIDDSVVTNLQNLGNALNNISMAMLSLTGVQLTSLISGVTTGFGLFGTLADSIDRAKSDIQHAVDSINSMNFTGIDESKVNQIKTTCDAIASFSEAFSGLTKIRGDSAWSDFTSWLLDGGFLGNGGQSISQAFESAHKDIVDASNAIQQFTDISDIDQGTVDKLKKVGDSIGAMGSAFEGLRKIRDDGNWDSFVGDFAGGLFKGKDDILTAFSNAKSSLVTISNELKGFGEQLPTLPEDLPTKLKSITDTLNNITGSLNSLKTIQDLGGEKGINFTNFVSTIQQARSSLKSVGDELKTLGGGGENGEGALVDIPEGLPAKLKALSKSLKSISTAITALSTIQTESNSGADFSSFATTIDKAKTGLVQVSGKLKELDGDKNLQGVSTELVTKLKNLSKSLKSISSAITSFKELDTQTGGTIDAGAMGTLVDGAKNALIAISGKLKSLQDNPNFQAVDESLASKIKNITSSVNKIISAIKSINKLDALGGEGGINVESINTLIKSAKDAIIKVATQLKSLSTNADFQAVDTTLPTKIANVRKGVKSLSKFATLGQGLQQVDGPNIGYKVARMVTGFNRAKSALANINKSDNTGGINEAINKVKTSVRNLKGAIKAMSFGSSGIHIGTSLSRGVTTGLAGLSGRVTGAIGKAGSAGGSRAYGIGSTIGSRMTSGFKTALNFVDAVNSEIDNVLSTIGSRAGEVESASSALSATGGYSDVSTGTTETGDGSATGGSFDTLVKTTDNMVRSVSNSNVAQKPLSQSSMNGLTSMSSQSQMNKTNQPVNIIVGEGAVQLDARDMTVKESRQVMINALEGLDMIQNIDFS